MKLTSYACVSILFGAPLADRNEQGRLNMKNAESNRSLYVLCVDDEPELLDALGDAVRARGLIPLTANSAAEAMPLLAKHHRSIVLVLSDYNMPDVHGLELRAKMLGEFKHVPFVIVSGHITREDALKGVELKIAGFAEKPFSPETMDNIIKEHSAERIANIRDEAELVQGFVADAENLIEEVESLLLVLESNPADMETINRIFAIAHTIKGASGFFVPKTIHRFTHAYEDFLSPYKKNAQPVPPEAVSVLLKGLDVIKSLLPPLQNGTAEPAPLEELLQVFNAPKEKSPHRDGETKTGSEAKAVQPPSPRDEIKVPISVLDQFMELSGEITVIRNMINKLVRAVEKDIPGNKNVNLLSELLDEMHKINGQMQDKVLDLRKFSCKNIFRPLKRAVRDLAGNLKKEIDFQTHGEELRVDTAVAEILGNSLIHMVRNCVDHGIENSETRRTAGKNPTGTISVEAKELNQEVVITIRDDGKGIDPEMIRRKVVEKKLYTTEAAARMTLQELQAVIFESGFSTAAQVTDVSGRGVGMDMVKKAVTGGGGRIEIESQPGKGSTIRLIIPVPKMVMIINSLLVRGGQHLLAIPQENLVRLLSVPSGHRKEVIRHTQGADFLFVENELFPILRLEATLALQSERSFSIPQGSEELRFALVSCEECRFALLVDEIFDVEDTVVKKLGQHLQDISLYRGATFLGDGRVGLILNISGLARHSGIGGTIPGAQSTGVISSERIADNQSKIRNLLLLEMRKPGLFGIFLDDIFRLENIPAKDLQRSGNIRIAIYRNEACPIFSGDDLLRYSSESDKESDASKNQLSILILSIDGYFLGIDVERIIDLVETNALADTELSDRKGISGALIHNEQTVTILNAAELFELAHERGIRLSTRPEDTSSKELEHFKSGAN